MQVQKDIRDRAKLLYDACLRQRYSVNSYGWYARKRGSGKFYISIMIIHPSIGWNTRNE